MDGLRGTSFSGTHGGAGALRVDVGCHVGLGDIMNQVIAVKMARGPTIRLGSGAEFDLLDPWNSEFTLEDVANALGKICRYSGQCSGFYSVAEHSLLVSQEAVGFELEALMHDAAEAFLGDVTRPLKQLLPQYKEIERNVEMAIYSRFNIGEF